MGLLRNPRRVSFFDLFYSLHRFTFNALEHVKPRPVTKGFRVVMNRSLHTVYGNSDSESEVDNSKKTDPTTGTGTIPEGSGTIANIQANTSKKNSTQMSEQEALPQTTPLDAVAPTIPNQ